MTDDDDVVFGLNLTSSIVVIHKSQSKSIF